MTATTAALLFLLALMVLATLLMVIAFMWHGIHLIRHPRRPTEDLHLNKHKVGL